MRPRGMNSGRVTPKVQASMYGKSIARIPGLPVANSSVSFQEKGTHIMKSSASTPTPSETAKFSATARPLIEQMISGGIEWFTDDLASPEKVDRAIASITQFRAAQRALANKGQVTLPALPLAETMTLAGYRLADRAETAAHLHDFGEDGDGRDMRQLLSDLRRAIYVYESFLDIEDQSPGCEFVTIEIQGGE